MKVLFDTHNTTFQYFGGQGVQMLQTKKYLEELGVEVKLYNKFEDNILDYDLYHLFGSNSIENIAMINYVKKNKIPIAVSPIYWNGFEQAMRGAENIFKKSFVALRKIQQVSEKILDYNVNLLNPTHFYLKNADILLPNSNLEAQHLNKIFGTNLSKIRVAYNGVDECYLKGTPDLFVDKYGIKNFVLYVGRIEPKKNIISLIKAMNDLEYPLVLIGNKDIDRSYYTLCKKYTNSNIHFLGELPPNSELLKSAYHAADVFTLPTWLETPGISALEAGLAGCNISITDRGSTVEYFKDMAFYCDPSSIESIKNSINSAMNQKKSSHLSKHILENYSWKAIAEHTLNAYHKIV